VSIASLLTRAEPVRWLFTGDSITHGAGHTYGERDFVQLFEERLRWELGRRRDHVIRTAISGRTVADLEADLDWSVRDYRPDVVSLMFGLNDCATTTPDTADFARRYRGIIDSLRSDGAEVILHTPNRLLTTDTAERQRNLPEYVEAVRALAAETGVVLVDHYADWRACDEAGQLEHWIEQGCHPGGAGHRVLARSLLIRLGMWDPSSTTGRFFVPAAEYLEDVA
jgi:lysophospholipase L1-like esterase